MDLAHQGSDQSFDMPAMVRPAKWTPIHLSSLLSATTRESFCFELASIVRSEPIGEPADRPLDINATVSEPPVFGLTIVRDASCNGSDAERFQRQVEAKSASRGNVDRQRDPGTSNTASMHVATARISTNVR